MSNDERRNFLKSYFLSDLSRHDLQDGRAQVLRARALECEAHEGLVQELLGCSRFAVAYSNANPTGYRVAKTGDARPYGVQQVERQCRGNGYTPGRQQRGFSPLDGDQKPRATFKTANISPIKRTQNPGPVASAESCRAADLPEGSSVEAVMEALYKSKS